MKGANELDPISMTGSLPRPQTAGNWLVERLREAIIAGELPANSAIRQEELAETYGVSRMPVRQALDILAVEGWVDLRPHRGAVVAALDPEDAIELFDLRLSLETLAIERSFPALTDAQKAQIERAWNALRNREGDVPALHQSLHMALYVAAGPRVMRLVLQQLDAVQRYLRFESSALQVSEADDQEHADLVAAALAGDVETGVRVLREHISGGGRGIARKLRERGMGTTT